MASRTEIFQLVAQHLGQDQVLVDPDEALPLAGIIRSVWDTARKATLRANNWNFATRRTQLAALSEVPAFGFSAQFAPPDDFVRLTDVVGLSDRGRDWEFEDGNILANVTTLYIKYVYDNAVVESWDDSFVQAMSLKIAELVAINITGDNGLRQGLGDMFRMAIAEAEKIDGQENPPIEFDEDTWITARYGGGANWGGYHPPMT